MIGRNDKCMCGSGKKYKKCCLLKEQEQEEQERKEFEEWLKKDEELGQRLLAEQREEMRKKGITS